ncbi:FadR/GntR family transcriptional regulator [Homoserinibacter sp. YIM 151385]|uniref:FadR/GntR family transcriptional regulator n=1 Tax=Homoserinibacter sp. YIM 151385 TaxID=2985506 RepID=UPI0022EFF2EE|nr:FadR/GntR family transcriptional regulator [Homoserinibacter sp. YIM 151385]WBU37482.1 FadR/GntR family transcriptional regulator [Homoserinibacter sp. YIM 151385]
MTDPTQGWTPVRKVRAHEQVMAQIEQRILDGELAAGDHLPNERDLSAMLGVSRPSLRESLRVFEALGIVEIRRGGEGGSVLAGEPGPAFVNLLKLQLALGQFSPHDVLDTRVALETWSCHEAARRATPEDHAALAAILDEMDDPEISAGEFNRLDAAFHVLIAEASTNALSAHLMQSLRIAINRQMIDAYARLDDWRETAKTVRAEHRRILELIRQRDSAGASDAVRDHIASFYALGGLSREAAAAPDGGARP